MNNLKLHSRVHMNDYTFYLVEKEPPVARVFLNRPEKKNAMGPAAWREPVEIFADLDSDPEIRVVIVAGPKDIALAKQAQEKMHQPAINLAGKTSLGQLAGLLKRCRIFICNDSGPMHIAAALEVPVIAIFGRAQDGLSPRRWGPLGKQSFVLHKDVGCIECLAHNCVKQFTCLQAITVNDIVKAAASILVHLGDTPESNRQGVPGRVTL